MPFSGSPVEKTMVLNGLVFPQRVLLLVRALFNQQFQETLLLLIVDLTSRDLSKANIEEVYLAVVRIAISDHVKQGRLKFKRCFFPIDIYRHIWNPLIVGWSDDRNCLAESVVRQPKIRICSRNGPWFQIHRELEDEGIISHDFFKQNQCIPTVFDRHIAYHGLEEPQDKPERQKLSIIYNSTNIKNSYSSKIANLSTQISEHVFG